MEYISKKVAAYGQFVLVFTLWQYSVYLFLWMISLWSTNSNLSFGKTFKIFLYLDSHANVSSAIIVLPLGITFFIILGLKSFLQLSRLWLWRWTLSKNYRKNISSPSLQYFFLSKSVCPRNSDPIVLLLYVQEVVTPFQNWSGWT